MKLRVTIDTDECNLDAIQPHVMEIDNEGVATMWYGSHNYFVSFKDVEIISCDHKCGTRRVRIAPNDNLYCYDECLDCGINMNGVIINE